MRKYDYSAPAVLNRFERYIRDGSGIPLVIPKRYDLGRVFKSGQIDYQITYKFSSGVRDNFFGSMSSYGNPITYGQKNMTFRRLHLILMKFNGGVDYIQEYFDSVLPYTALGREIDEYISNGVHEYQNEYGFMHGVRATKSGEMDRRQRGKISGLLESAGFRLFLGGQFKSKARNLEQRLKADLVCALRDGRVPLSPSLVSEATQYKRIRAGLSPVPRFYASGQFINSITVYVRLGK